MNKSTKKICLTFCFITILLCMSNNSLFAQADSLSLRQKAEKAITERFPTTRFVNIEYKYTTPSDIKTKNKSQFIGKTKIEEQNSVKVNINLPLYRFQKWTLIGNFDYNYTHLYLRDLQPLKNTFSSTTIDGSLFEGHVFNAAINAMYISRVFNKPLIYNMSVVSHFSEKGFERITGAGFASMLLKRDKKLSITTGIAVIVDPMILIPVLPIFGLEYKLRNDWLLSLALPQYLFVRKFFSQNTRLSFGSFMTNTSYYMHPNNGHSYLYNKAEINTGIVFEQYLNKHLILTARSGVVNSLRGNINQKNKTYSKRFISSNQGPGLYFNLGVSYNLY